MLGDSSRVFIYSTPWLDGASGIAEHKFSIWFVEAHCTPQPGCSSGVFSTVKAPISCLIV